MDPHLASRSSVARRRAPRWASSRVDRDVTRILPVAGRTPSNPPAWSGRGGGILARGLPPRRPAVRGRTAAAEVPGVEAGRRRLLPELDAALSDTPDRTALTLAAERWVGCASWTTGSALTGRVGTDIDPQMLTWPGLWPRPSDSVMSASSRTTCSQRLCRSGPRTWCTPGSSSPHSAARPTSWPPSCGSPGRRGRGRRDPDTSSWHYTPDAPRTQQLIGLILAVFPPAAGTSTRAGVPPA